MKHDEAKAIADKWIRYLSPACERIEIAGSIRRGKQEPKDIEIVCQPKLIDKPDLFGEATQVNLLETYFETSLFRVTAAFILKNGPRYKQLALVEGVKLDLFIVLPPAQWGVQFLIRTGPADFSHWCVTQKRLGGALPSYLKVKDGAVWHGVKKLDVPEEEDYFKLCGMKYIEPKYRLAHWLGLQQEKELSQRKAASNG
jgi:DNA polymerase/3'-5' exonuclease PolX